MYLNTCVCVCEPFSQEKMISLNEEARKLDAEMKILERTKSDAESETIDVKHQLSKLKDEIKNTQSIIQCLRREVV